MLTIFLRSVILYAASLLAMRALSEEYAASAEDLRTLAEA